MRWLAALGLLLAASGSGVSQVQKPAANPEDQVAEEQKGLIFRLSEGSTREESPVAIARPPATPLDDGATQRVLDRLPPWVHEPREEDVALREESLPPPRAGRTVDTPFPPPRTMEAPAPRTDAPLAVLRHAPEDEVPLAPRLSVTFSQPMVAVTSHADLALATPPVRLSPEPPGEWMWVGTRTLVFEPEGRFPMATDYRAEVPAGTRAVSGNALEADHVWTFSTPPPTLLERYPEGGPTGPEPILLASFDQRIDADAVLQHAKVRAGGALWSVRLATDEEVAADDAVLRLAESAGEGRWLAFRAERPLPTDAAVTVAISAGTPSAEGPRRTDETQSWSFRTRGPFRVADHECGWRGGPCSPGDPWRIRLTNPIDTRAFRSDQLTVDPEVPGIEISARGDTIFVRGRARGRTTYRVGLASEIRDVFGQTLGDSAAVEFPVGPAEATLFAPGGDFVVLVPSRTPRFPVYSVNHSRLHVEAWAVEPADWDAWRDYQQRHARGDAATPPGESVLDTVVDVGGPPDALVETAIDLSPALRDGLGQIVLVVRPDPPPERDRGRQRVQAWVQVTHLGLDAFADDRSLLAWVTALEDGRPLNDVDVSLVPGNSARTDVSGLARFDLGEPPSPLLVARRGNDLALLPAQTSWWGRGGWSRGEQKDTLRFCVFDDRHLYRPGEKVHVKGWARVLGAGPRGDLGPVPSGLSSLSWTLFDSRGNEIEDGMAALGGTGGFDLAFALPPTMNLGTARLVLEAPEAPGETARRHTHAFEVQEFRRPEFEVTASATEGPHFVGGHVTAMVSARYFAGGALPGADVSWRVAARPATFRPPGWDGFVFGTYVPWWRPWPEPPEPEGVETFSSRTDGAGEHHLRIDLDRAWPPRPRHLEAEATVLDVNRQAWTASVGLLVHPANLYVGLRVERAFVEKGEAIPVDVVVTGLDGTATSGRRVRLRAERLHQEQIGGEWRVVPRDVQEQEVETTTSPVTVRFDGIEGGEWRVVAGVADDTARPNETELRVWVSGGPVPPRRDLEQEEVTLVPDAREYRAGDVARVLVRSPFAPAEGLLTLRRSGLLREERFRVEEGSHTLEIPIEEGWTPNVHLQVDLVGATSGEEGSGSRPAFARGALDLSIPPVSRRLQLEVTPRTPALAPGEETVLEVALRDSGGRPVAGSEVAVVVVDEAVLALTGYRLPDVLDFFYSERAADVRDDHLRSHVVFGLAEEQLSEDLVLEGRGGAPETMMTLDAQAPMPARAMRAEAAPPPPPQTQPLRARTDFSALALFAPSLITDAQGRAHVSLKVPDNLTRYRIMAVAASGAQRFGSGEASLVARLPLMVRPSPPRFLNFGDRFELPVVVQNQTDGELSVDVAVRAQGAELNAGAGRRLVVAANDRAEVRFPASASHAGRAMFQLGAVSGTLADAAELSLPVWTPATTEAFATYGQVDEGVLAQPVRAPEGVLPQFGGLEVTTSSTALQALTDAVLYLVAYPFECAEQLSSRILAVAALRDVLAAFEAEGLPGPEEMRATVARDVDLLRALQNEDGGFGFWKRGDPSWPWVSVHAAHALARARDKGFDVPDATLERSLDYLQNLARHMPEDYPENIRRTLVAYSLDVRRRLGDPDPTAARALIHDAGVEGLSFEALGWVLSLLSGDGESAAEVEAIRRRLANGVVETAASAHFAVSYDDGDHLLLYSDRRADAVVLEALIGDQPQSDLVPKLVTGLLAHRRAGRWSSTQENVFVLLALDRYFQAYESTTPDFVARAWLGERYAGEHAFRGHTTDSHRVSIPMAALRDAGDPTSLLLSKDGPGRLYYRIGLRYAPQSLRLEPLDRGFALERAYEAVDDEGDVRRDDEGTWRIRAGARVQVTVTMVAPTRRYHVALVDPLPAGLEALNPTLATTGTLPGEGRGEMDSWWWPRPWFEHQNLRDERVEAFSSLLWAGVHTYSYVARATTPGRFVVPPPKAEEMYTPETFGRGATDVVVVE